MKLKDLDIWLKDLFSIIVDLNISLNNSKYLINEKGSESAESIKSLGFFSHHIYQLKFIVIIQLCKVFDNRKNQKRNIHKLFNKLRNEGYDEKFNSLLQKNSESEIGLKSKCDIIKTINYLEQEIYKETKTIEKIISLRDKIYAHSDSNNNSEDVYWSELETLINLASKCYNDLYGKLYNSDTRFKPTLNQDIRKVIEGFARCKDLNKR